MKRQRRKYERPRHPFQKGRVQKEDKLLSKYGLKNKKEIWKAESVARGLRRTARRLISLEASGEDVEEEKGKVFSKARRLGLIKEKDIKLDDILNLTVKDILDRRLQTVVYRKRMANTPKQARQFIVHGHIQINGHRVSVPGYLVKKEEENKIRFRPSSPIRGRFKVRKIPKEVKKKERKERKERKGFVCPECGKKFSSERGLAIHKGMVHK